MDILITVLRRIMLVIACHPVTFPSTGLLRQPALKWRRRCRELGIQAQPYQAGRRTNMTKAEMIHACRVGKVKKKKERVMGLNEARKKCRKLGVKVQWYDECGNRHSLPKTELLRLLQEHEKRG